MATKVYLFLPKPASPAHLREAHAYGPSSSGFHTDLGIEIDPSQLDKNEAIAVVSGTVRLVPNPLSPQTCTAVLMPSLEAVRDLSQVLGAGVVVFVYRNLVKLDTPPSTPAGAQSWPVAPLDGWAFKIKELNIPKLQVQNRSQQWAQFINGDMPIDVEAGVKLFQPSTIGGTGAWGYLGFEIVFIPSGLWSKDGPPRVLGWNRLKELIDPAALTRRLDPMAFYRRVKAAAPPVSFAGEPDHELLTKTTRRTLLELRDEYDEPFSGTAYVYDGGQTTPFDFDLNQRGTIELPATVTFSTVDVPGYVFTELPSGSIAEAPAPRHLESPEHWSVQAIYMSQNPDPVDEFKSWFAVNTSPLDALSNSVLPRYTEGNKITVIRDGIDVFKEYVKSISRLAAGDSMCLAGWVLMDNFDLIYEKPGVVGYPNFSINKLLTAAANRGAKVRALLWKQDPTFAPALANAVDTAVANINALPNGAGRALADKVTNVAGSHHQKLFVFSGQSGFAFCGGVDINPDRRDSPNHGATGAFHDVHAKVEGPAVADIYNSFKNRWNSHSQLKPISNDPNDPDFESPPKFKAQVGSVYVQVACTYSNRMPYAPHGSTAPLNAVLRAIRKARKFIYIEDQYLMPYSGIAPHQAFPDGDVIEDRLGVLNALREALRKDNPPHVLVVIPNYAAVGWLTQWGGDGQGRFRRKQFIDALIEMDPGIRGGGSQPEKVHIFYLRRRNGRRRLAQEEATDGGCDACSGGIAHRDEIYCHSKVWIVDDVIAKIGSANCNRRSYTHDSEMDIIMVDGAVTNGRRTFARDLRVELWAEHLGMSKSRRAQLEDYDVAIKYWLLDPQLPQSRIVPYDHDQDIESFHSLWDTAVDPDGR